MYVLVLCLLVGSSWGRTLQSRDVEDIAEILLQLESRDGEMGYRDGEMASPDAEQAPMGDIGRPTRTTGVHRQGAKAVHR